MASYTVNGQTVALTQTNYVAEGGQGKVYAKNGVAYKVYHDPSKMIPTGKIQELSTLPIPPFNRPEDLILDSKGKVAGYTSRFVKNAYVLCQLFPKSFRDREGLTPAQSFHLVEQLQQGVQTAHGQGILIVDLNEMNFLVSQDFKSMWFIDTDSYQTRNYPAVALMESVRDRHMKSPNAFNEGTDWFAFAITAFQTLVGIHPYKGKHPSVKGFEDRMRQNISVFHPDVSVPPSVLDFSVIPKTWRGWFESVFDKGDRNAPPSGVVAIPVLQMVVKTLTGSSHFDLQEVRNCDGNVYGIWSNGKGLVIASEHDVWLHNRKFVSPQHRMSGVGFSPAGKTITGSMVNGFLKLTDLESGQDVPFGVTCDSVTTLNGQMFVKSLDKILALDLRDIGDSVVATSRVAATVLPQASRLYQGCVIQNLLGSTFVSLFDGVNTYQVRIPELDKQQVIDAKWDSGAKGGVLGVVTSDGNGYIRRMFRFDKAMAYDIDIASGLQTGELNFVVTDAGVCIQLDTDFDTLTLMSVTKGSGSRKVIDRVGLRGSLYRDGSKVLVANGNTVTSVRMK